MIWISKRGVAFAISYMGISVLAGQQSWAQPVYNPANGHYYETVTTEYLNWDAASSLAASRSYGGFQGYLATITSADENDFIDQFANFPAIDKSWIGGVRNGYTNDWAWITGEQWTYSNWGPGQPSGGSEDRLQMWGNTNTSEDGTWNDALSSNTAGVKTFIVEYGAPNQSLPAYNPSNGHYYQVVDPSDAAGLTWTEANDRATQSSFNGLKGHLATVTDGGENNFLKSITNSYSHADYYIGGRQSENGSEPSGGWGWVTGEPWSYTNWNTGEPNNGPASPNQEEYLEFYNLPADSVRHGKWNDANGANPSDTPFGYIVEYSPIAPNVVPAPGPPPNHFRQIVEPSDAQLEILHDHSGIDVSKPTIVLTHGWQPTGQENPDQYFNDLVTSLKQAASSGAIDANIVAWNWSQDAHDHFPSAAAKTYLQGGGLGEALALSLTNDQSQEYTQPIHFIGHSLGARVNKEAADTIHLNGLDWRNTHVTILDSPDLGDMDRQPWQSSIPDQAAWIDNYISLVGELHPEAANVILREGMPISFFPGAGSIADAIEFHGYPVDWYSQSVTSPTLSDMGHRWAFERDGLNGSPAPGTNFAQTVTLGDHELTLEHISQTEAETILFGRAVLGIGQIGLLAVDPSKTIAGQGKVAVELVEKSRKFIGQAEQTYHTLRFILEEQSPAYVWVPTEVPEKAGWMSFELMFENVGSDDFLTVGIQDTLLFVLDGNQVQDGLLVNSGLLDISDFAGQEVELFFGLNSDDVVGGKMTIEGVTFHGVPEPSSLAVLVISGLGILCRRHAA